MQPTQINKLPLWPFWDKNHLAGLKKKKTFLVQNKKKNYLFVSKGQRVNSVEKPAKNYSPLMSQ
jgi:hypothetical protein